MRIIDLLEKAGFAIDGLKSLLKKIEEKAPDLADEVEAIELKLEESLTADVIVDLAEYLPGEILNIAKGHIDSRKHPGDVI